MRPSTVAFISTLLLSPISVLSTFHEKSAELDHPASAAPNNELVIKIKLQVDGENIEKTCPINKKKAKNPCYKVHTCKKKSKPCDGMKLKLKGGAKCKGKFIKWSKILASATEACNKIRKEGDHKLPPPYAASNFSETSGPYVEWPIYNKVWHFGLKKKYRIVMTEKCELVGAVIRNKDTSYTKCKFGEKKGRKH